MEDGLQDGLQISLDDFLGDAIGDRWNTQRPLSVFLRASGSSPVAPAEESSSPRTFGSTACRGCPIARPQTSATDCPSTPAAP